ncbi:MAG: YggS family pyridoxal phosphate enzyme [Gammaproteobacteria bacterium RIFCSPHIGHO2_12_FULL_45_9]|nr:MAG: YggS family pyridoxal phosphate enzyme [Gammaproteobacteria bacterium RIFCSPHIGHO2_12_FULL_45_9]
MRQTAWQAVQHRICTAVLAAKRSLQSVQLLAVSKGQSPEAIRALWALGQCAFGESYVQEWQTKFATLSDCVGLEWHFIGNIQSNKTRFIAEHATWVHSVNSIRIAKRLSLQRPSQLAPLQVCIEVNISDESSKSGVLIAALPELIEVMRALPQLVLRGLMVIPDPYLTKEDARATFAATAALAKTYQLDTLSMGMSADLELAIAEGATWVRVGRALFSGEQDV